MIRFVILLILVFTTCFSCAKHPGTSANDEIEEFSFSISQAKIDFASNGSDSRAFIKCIVLYEADQYIPVSDVIGLLILEEYFENMLRRVDDSFEMPEKTELELAELYIEGKKPFIVKDRLPNQPEVVKEDVLKVKQRVDHINGMATVWINDLDIYRLKRSEEHGWKVFDRDFPTNKY